MPATTEKPPTLAGELAALDRMTAAELRDRYAAAFGEPAAFGNRAWLARRVGCRMQALAEGDLSERAKACAAELDPDVRERREAELARLRGRVAGCPTR